MFAGLMLQVKVGYKPEITAERRKERRWLDAEKRKETQLILNW